ncbi:MAG: hypothetical protein WA021_04655, partial [Minisyncoccia bacterium]
MSLEKSSGLIKKEDPFRADATSFTDADRSAVLKRRDQKDLAGKVDAPEASRKGLMNAVRNFIRKQEKGKPNVEPKIEEIDSMGKFLEELATTITRKEKNHYPFLTDLGTEAFDERILPKTIHAYEHRVQKIRKVVSNNPPPLSFSRHSSISMVIEQQIHSIYQAHIPAYTDMMINLDEKKTKTEVFLGRDAVFM